MEHTKGQWRIVGETNDCLCIEADQGKGYDNPTICHLYRDVTPDDSVTMCDWLEPFDNAKANAALIKAAPKLLAALRDLLHVHGCSNDCAVCDEARAAIDLAKSVY